MAVRVMVGIFLILHGLVHLLYNGQSARRFELAPGLTWPDGSWAFSKRLGAGTARDLAGIGCILAAAGFMIGGAGLIFDQTWWRFITAASAGLSAVVYILFWNGRGQGLAEQGAVGILIDLAVLAVVVMWGRP